MNTHDGEESQLHRPHRYVAVVGYDGSEAARAALTYAATESGTRGRLIVVHAYGHPTDMPERYERTFEDHRARGQAVLDGILLDGNDELADVDYELELRDAPAAEALVAVARDRGAEEIVVGARGLGRVRAALGSVTHDLLHLSDRPLVVITERAAELGYGRRR